MEQLIQKLSPEKRKEIEDRIKFLDMRQYAIKIMINSIYGAGANKYFYFHNVDIAQSITIQGQHLIKFSSVIVNDYFKEKWSTDIWLHEQLGISDKKINPIPKNFDMWAYGDTDSIYFNFGMVYDSVVGLNLNDIDKILFISNIIKHRLKLYLESAFDQYAKAFGTKSQMKFALENISKDGIFVAKKMYCIRIMFEDGVLTKKPKLKTRGIDHAKPSWPGWARERIEQMMIKLLDCGKDMVHERDIIPILREHMKMFKLVNIDDICFNKNIKNYNQYIIDLKNLEFTKGIPIGARACAYYNHILEEAGDMKYPKIRQGDRVKMYHAKHPTNPEMNIFAYHMYNHPADLAIPIDYDEQFFRLLVEPMNKLIKAMGMHEITAQLKRNVPVVMPKVRRDIKDDEMYPLWAISNKTYECAQVPTKLNKYIMDDSKEVTETVLEEYIKYVNMFGMDTVICCNMEKDKHIERLKKKYCERMFKERILEKLPPIEAYNIKEALPRLKELKYKMEIDDGTFEPVFTRTRSKIQYKLVYQNMMMVKTPDQYITILNKIFENDLAAEAEAEIKKGQKAAEKLAKAGSVAPVVDPNVVMPVGIQAVTFLTGDNNTFIGEESIANNPDLPLMISDIDKTI